MREDCIFIYARRTDGRWRFWYGWALFSLIQSGSIATLASGFFGLYLSKIVPLSPLEFKGLPILCIASFSIANLYGIRFARTVQNIGTISKLAGLVLVFFLLIDHGHTRLLRLEVPPHPSSASLLAFGTALVAVLWAYEGWHVVSFTAGEVSLARTRSAKKVCFGAHQS